MKLTSHFYAIVDPIAGHDPVELARTMLEAGARIMQLRLKNVATRDFLAAARAISQLCHRRDAIFIVNDRIDIAMLSDADGVHLGSNSMPVHRARRLLGPDRFIGFSCHNQVNAIMAQESGVDFITFGPIFETPSKMQYGAPVGTDALRAVKKLVRIPVFGLGGIRTDNIPEVMQAGADGIAMISAIFAAGDIKKSAIEVIKAITP